MEVGSWLMADVVWAGDSWVMVATCSGIVNGLTLILSRGTVLLRRGGVTLAGMAGFGEGVMV